MAEITELTKRKRSSEYEEMNRVRALHKYFHIPEEIEQLEIKRRDFSRNFYNEHSFYSHIVYTGHDIHSEAPAVETLAINLVDAQQSLNNHIKRKRRVYRQFMNWVETLPVDKQFHLEAKYIDYEATSYWAIEDVAYRKIIDLDAGARII